MTDENIEQPPAESPPPPPPAVPGVVPPPADDSWLTMELIEKAAKISLEETRDNE